MIVLRALLSHWVQRPVQLASLLLGLALATALFTGVQAINAEARTSYARAAAMLGQDQLSRIEAEDGQLFDQASFVKLRRAGWKVSPVVEGELRVAGSTARLMGVEPVSAPASAAPAPLAETNELLRFLQGNVGFAAPATAANWSSIDPLPELRPLEGLIEGVVLLDIGQAQRLLGMEGQISHLVLADGGEGASALPQGLVIRPPGGAGDVARLTDSFHLNLTAFGLLSFVVGLFIVHGAVGLAFEQRRAMFRTLRALGVPLNGLMASLLTELLVLAFLAGVVGVALGYLVASLLLPDVSATLRGLYGASVASSLSLQPSWWLGGLAVSLIGALIAAGQSLWRLASMPLLAPAQPRAWMRASERGMRMQLGAGIALLGISGLLIWQAQGLVTGFAALGTLLLGAALCLPVLLGWVLQRLTAAARGVGREWFWADTGQQLPGVSLALMALLLALSANIGVGTMVSSFRMTFVEWLDQRLSSELYATARDQAEGEALRAWLADQDVDVLPIWNVKVELFNAPAELFGVTDHPTYRQNWRLLQALEAPWDKLAAGDHVMINEQLARREGLWPGDALTLPNGRAMTVAGVYGDYGNPLAQLHVTTDLLVQLYPDVPRLRHAVRVAPDQAEALRQALITDFGLPASQMIDQASIKQASLNVFERTFTVTAALNVLTMAVAGFALLTSLLTLSGMRLPQLAPVWAMGWTRRRLAGAELLRAILLAGFVMVCAVPLGLALSWILLNVVNVAAFGWQLPMFLFPGQWATLGLLALVVAGLAALWPAWRLSKLPPAELLKVFANER
ncbi:FtsX-like permease family protein [Actibacterium pelagium]|uniref:ABC transporter permease n=1 Tax=Actibacterium pelagium TaxID=2029103 RepID=A0A917EKK8_9RHOB|nr:ABC transporter permease [Actibacterium pelagium]GGE57629.1 ABC transporter permease [Actibacterium pelagium]